MLPDKQCVVENTSPTTNRLQEVADILVCQNHTEMRKILKVLNLIELSAHNHQTAHPLLTLHQCCLLSFLSLSAS